jgi:mono/diheme cytochrome c family protein
MRADTYQILLIASGVIVTALFGIFFYREVFPEYKIYQNDYMALEEFRSTYTHQPVPPFKPGIKQIVIEREDRGPAIIDRCTSCHVALQIPYFSPTKIAYDLNGNMLRDTDGRPILVPNEEYIWQKLDEKIAELRDEKVIEQLKSQGETKEVQQRLDQAAKYEALKTAQVGEHVYDVTKVLAMHPLMGNETRPFEFHPIEEYGCTSCHNGNGRGLVTDKAHGPVFDGQYEIEFRPTRQFTESDPANDPPFAHVFNHKPGHALLFQTEPIFVGALIQAKCMQCHQTSDVKLTKVADSTSDLSQRRQKQLAKLAEAYENEKQAVLDLLQLQQFIAEKGYVQTLKHLQELQSNYSLSASELEHLAMQAQYVEKAAKGQSQEERAQSYVLAQINQDLLKFLGSDGLVKQLEDLYQTEGKNALNPFLKQHQQDPDAKGTLFAKGEALDINQDLMRHVEDVSQSFATATADLKGMAALTSDVDELTRNYQRGKELYISQACYACHRIAGFARGGIGPELTRIGNSYPWYIKESIVWPQADLPTSTMPNMRLDHRELEDLMAYLLAQKGGSRAVAQTAYQADLQAWEAGRKMPWEKPIPPAQMYDLRYAMTVFATEGCAACHRLQGFDSKVGFKIEKESPTFDQLYEQQRWFRKLFPEVVHFKDYDEELPGSEIVAIIEKNAKEIDDRIVADVRQDGILEEIDRKHPEAIESLYSPFRYALRAKDHHYRTLMDREKDAEKIAQIKKEWQAWKERVHRVFMMYIQTYGLGRLIGPHLNWSGIYRTDEWLMEHFRNPASHVPRSIMPVFPFDDTKFYSLTHMLDVLAVRNRHALRQIWDQQGFSAAEAYDMLCAQCHGVGMVGNGVIAEWIYPIPKNLHNPEFLRNLTKEKAIYSITHGVKGTPMPPWGEFAPNKPTDVEKISHGQTVFTENEIRYLVDWLFSNLPGGEVIRQAADVPKWQYSPEDVLQELEKEGGHLVPLSPEEEKEQDKEKREPPARGLPQKNSLPLTVDKSTSLFWLPGPEYYAAIRPEIYPRQVPKEKKQELKVEDVFDIVPNSTDTGSVSYYIKKKYYTPYNIEEGQKFFLLNCAVCHGNEADGSGVRGQTMREAKPRMLTNLDWISSRDDLRLLRSIKYGVPGTAMTPWGDLTNSLQRLQLVIFIRSLTEEKEKRDKLAQAIYQTFETAQLTIDNARIDGSQQIAQLQQEVKKLRAQQEELERKITEGRESPNAVLPIYEKNLDIERKIKKIQEQDQQMLQLKSLLKREQDLYFSIGINLISKDVGRLAFQTYLNLIELNAHRYTLQNHQLKIQDQQVSDRMRAARQEIVRQLDQKIAELEQKRQIIEGKIVSAQQREELMANQAAIEGFKKIKAKLITDTEEALRLANEQAEIVKSLSREPGVRSQESGARRRNRQ